MKGSKYFVYEGKKFGTGTRVKFTYDFYTRHWRQNCFFNDPKYGNNPSSFTCILYENGKTIWYFNNCKVDSLVPSRDIESIVYPVLYVEKTAKDIKEEAKERIRKKRERGETLEYIWPGTIIYIISMIFMPIFKEFLWGWIAATILYNNYCFEQLSQ